MAKSFLKLVSAELYRLITCILICFCSTIHAETIVVTRIDSNFDHLTKTELNQLWLKQIFYINDIKIDIRDLPEKHPARLVFYNHAIGKSGKKLSAYWAIRVFRGEDFPPVTLASEKKAIQWVIGAKNRAVYLDSRHLNKDVKTVYIVADAIE
jgi:hypothetical protein